MFSPPEGWHWDLPHEPAQQRLLDSSFAEVASDLDDELQRSLGWTLLLADGGGDRRVDPSSISSFQYTAVGFVDRELDQLDQSYPPFGVILYAESEEHPQPRAGQLEELTVGGLTFPIVLRRVRYEQHRAALHRVPGGSAAYWAESRGGARAGWLTARHVADGVTFSQSQYTVVDRGSACIDAALVSDGNPQLGLSAVQAFQTITAGLTVSMACNAPASPTVLDVSSNIRISRSSRFPLRFSLSDSGQPGDSGSAIEETSTAQQLPLGIYLGSYIPDTGYPGHTGRAGIGLSISQLEQLMQLKVFR
jgi:hypothetical protein